MLEEEKKTALQLDDAQYKKNWMHCSSNCRYAWNIEYYKWQKGFLNNRRRDFITSVLKGEEGSTYDAIGDAA